MQWCAGVIDTEHLDCDVSPTGGRYREWCQCKSVLGNGVPMGVLGVLAACVVVCVRGLAVVSGWCFVS